MKETVEEASHQIFFDICEKNPMDIDVFFLNGINFPKIEYLPRMTVYLPLPREINGKNIYEGIIFSDYESGQETIWNLFFASICHAAGHAKVTDFSKYENWIKGKNEKKAYKVIEFIENIKVNNFLEKSFPEYFHEISKIDKAFKIINENQRERDQKNVREKFSEKFNLKNLDIDKIKQEILESSSKYTDKLIEIADLLYNNESIIVEDKIPYVDHYFHLEKVSNWQQNIIINPDGKVKKNIQNFIDIWFEQLKHKTRAQKRYGGLTNNLNFDRIEFAPENIGEYLRLRNSTNMFLKKMSSQMKMSPNIKDDETPEDIGLLQMQAAIQAIAAQNNSIQIFDQDQNRKIEEEWAIILDTSSSMRLKFDEMKKFALALGEAANEVNSKNGKWGFYTFNNNFRIVKDHYERYDQTARSRVGGIEISGLSFINDAIKLCTRILEKENIEKKYIFLVTDGQQLGTMDNKDMEESVMEARKKGITVVAIGLPQGNTKIFNLCVPYENIRKTVSKFIAAYTKISSDDL